MPAATDYQPDSRPLREAADDELRIRRQTYREAWNYYEGRHRRQVATRPGEPDDNVVINLVRQAIDRTVSFLVPHFPGLEVGGPLDAPDTDQAEAWLYTAWTASGGARLLAKLAKHGCLGGHVVARILPPAAPGDNPALPRVVALNPANLVTFWQADDFEQVLWYEIHWEVARTLHRQDVVRAGESWLIREWRQEGPGWRLINEAAWPYPLGPIVDWQHSLAPDRYYGTGEAQNIALNDRVNKMMSDISRILRYHAAPRTVGTGFQAEQVTPTAVNHFWTIPNPDARVYNLEMQSDLSSSMAAAEFLARAFMAEQRVVVLKGEVSDWSNITNLGIRALFMDMIAKNEELRRNYEIGIAAISQRMRMLAGHADYRAQVRVNWPDPLPIGAAETVAVLERERALGIVSRETAARERGRDWTIESARLAEEDDSRPVPLPRLPMP